MKRSTTIASRALVSAIALAVGGAASAAEFDYGVLVGGSYSDNVERTSVDEQSSGAAVVGLDLRGVRETGRLQYDLFADLEYRDYFEDEVESQEFGRLIAQSSYAFVPERFEWLLSGSFDQVREDLLRPVAPDNLENVITLSTGPRVSTQFGDAFEAQGEAHYTMADYSERDGDNTTAGALVTVGRRLSERSFVGVGASYDDVNYDLAGGRDGPDFERREYFLRFNTAGARTDFEADVGYTEVSGVGVEETAPMARLRLTRRLTPFVSGYLGYTREFPTSADASFTPEPEQGDVTEDASILTAGPRENEVAEIGLLMNRPRTTASLVYARRTEETVETAGTPSAEREFDEVLVSFSRLITTRSHLELYGTYTKENVPATALTPSADSEEKVFGAGLHLAFGRALGLEVRIEHRDRDSDVGVGEYEELSGGIFVRYGSARRQGQAPGGTP